MTTVVLDTETYPIRDGLQAPRMVCLGASVDGGSPELWARKEGVERFVEWSTDPTSFLVGHSLSFDLCVLLRATAEIKGESVAESCLASLFELGERGHLLDTLYQEKFLLLATVGRFPRAGGLALADLQRKYCALDRSQEKKGYDAWRLRYAELDGVPLDEWPEAAVSYALADVQGTLDVARRQVASTRVSGVEGYAVEHPVLGHYIPRAALRTATALALQLTTVWGLRVDASRLDAVRRRLESELEATTPELIASGLLRPALTVDTKALKRAVERASAAAGVPAPRTAKGAIRTNRDTLEVLGPHDPVLQVLVRRNAARHALDSYVAKLEPGTRRAICPQYDALKETGRTSSFGAYPVQQTPRSGGIRETFCPRPGRLFASADYDSAELRSWAQVCLVLVGRSTLAERYKDDPTFDPHLFFAAHLLQIGYDEAQARKKAGDKEVSEARQLAKIPNFGYPGGMGARRLVEYARGFGVEITERRAQELKDLWLRVWPEARPYFDLISRTLGLKESTTITQIFSGRVRAGCRYTEACNTLFQGLTADGALDALRAISRECYTVPTSPLYSARVIAFVHDEFLLEVVDDPVRATAAALRLAKVAQERMDAWTPDVPARCSPVLSTAWSKGAESTLGPDGLLSIWSPDG